MIEPQILVSFVQTTKGSEKFSVTSENIINGVLLLQVFLLESPYHTISLSSWKNQINWTATYRSDSTIVAPYERFTYFNTSITKLPLAKNYAADKKKKVAWFVSNCGARNNRLGYAQELAKHIEVSRNGHSFSIDTGLLYVHV